MALTKSLTSPISQPSLDKARLIMVQVDPINKLLMVQIGVGFEDNGSFVVKSAASYNISGDEYDVLMTALGDSAKAIGLSLEEAIWAKLVAMGVIEVA